MRRPGTDTQPRPGARQFPDRSAYLHRRRAHRAFAVVALLLLVLPWLAFRNVRELLDGLRAPPEPVPSLEAPAGAGGALPSASRVPPAPAPAAELDPARTASQLARIRAGTRSGDQAAVQAGVDALAEDVRQSMRLAERGSMVHREAARARVQAMPGVRAAGWIDRTHLLVVVARDDLRADPMIDGICAVLRASGDPEGVVVHLQSGEARRATRAGLLGRDCGASPAVPAAVRPGPATPGAPAVRAGALPAPADLEAHRRRNAESMRILEETTPEM